MIILSYRFDFKMRGEDSGVGVRVRHSPLLWQLEPEHVLVFVAWPQDDRAVRICDKDKRKEKRTLCYDGVQGIIRLSIVRLQTF